MAARGLLAARFRGPTKGLYTSVAAQHYESALQSLLHVPPNALLPGVRHCAIYPILVKLYRRGRSSDGMCGRLIAAAPIWNRSQTCAQPVFVDHTKVTATPEAPSAAERVGAESSIRWGGKSGARAGPCRYRGAIRNISPLVAPPELAP